MANVYSKGVTGIGISNDMPAEVKYFTEFIVTENLVIPPQKPDMEKLISVMVSPEIVSTKLIETPVALSNEGQNLSGYKMIVELNLKEKVKYVAKRCTQSVHAAHFDNVLKSVFIVVPAEVNGERVCDLVRRKRFSVTPYIEDIYAVMKDERSIFKNVTILIDIKFF